MTKLPGLIGVIHLPALAGSPGSQGLSPSAAMAQAGAWAVKEARTLAQAGFEGLILENFGDSPFFAEKVGPETVACLSVIAAAVRESVRIPLGINVLRNDALSALAIASVTGCDFIRVNVLSGVAASDQGILQGQAAQLLRERDRLGSEVRIFADAHVKHAQSLSSHSIELALEENALRAGADGVILTGDTTGRPVDLEQLQKASRAARHHGVPLWIGSGATAESLPELLGWADGIIVGSALRKGGRAAQPLDLKRVRELVRAWRNTRKSSARGRKASQKKSQKRGGRAR